MKKIVSIVAIMFLASSCAMKQRILNASAVSMTKYSTKKKAKVEEAGEVTGEFCADSTGDSGTIGLLDEAIKDAQNKSGADYITNAIFYSKGNCVMVEGMAMKIKK